MTPSTQRLGHSAALPARETPSRSAPHGRECAEVTLLGGFSLTLSGHEIRLPVGAQRLVALLGLRGQIGRSRVAGTLWPDRPQPRALASLRTGIWRVNQAAHDLVIATAGQVALDSHAEVDVRTLVSRSIEIFQGDVRTGLPAFATGISEGDLLPDWDEAWLTDERARLHQLRMHVLETVADHLMDRGQFGLAIEVALTILRTDPLRESAHRSLVRIHLAEGNLDEARRAYIACEQVLDRELGIRPTTAMTDLLNRLPWPRGNGRQSNGKIHEEPGWAAQAASFAAP